MTAFRDDGSEREHLDWQLFQDGAVAMYHKQSLLAEDLAWLSDHGYQIYEFNCERWNCELDFHNDFKRVLNFPDWYGCNLNALRDSLSDLSIPANGGAALVLYRYDSYTASAGLISGRPYAEVILDILAGNSRFLMLTGKRFLTMIQSDDPRIRFEKLGCVSAIWNPREWLDKDRGL